MGMIYLATGTVDAINERTSMQVVLAANVQFALNTNPAATHEPAVHAFPNNSAVRLRKKQQCESPRADLW